MKEIGQKLIEKCELLVVDYLNKNVDGATNQQVARGTGLFLDIPHHKGYISWTLLEHLAAKGNVEKMHQGNKKTLYRLKT